MDLTDEQWVVREPLFRHAGAPVKAGRPRQEPRPVVEAVLWVLRTCAPGRTFRCKRRWRVERRFAWLTPLRRIATRCEHEAKNDLGVVHLGCIVLTLRQI